MLAFIKPGQPDWFVGRNAPIKALEFRRSSLHRRAGLAPRVASVSMTASRLLWLVSYIQNIFTIENR
jgi:hypothetical protein